MRAGTVTARMRRAGSLALAIGLPAALEGAGAASDSRDLSSDSPRLQLEVEAPADAVVIRQIVPLVEVRGRGGLGVATAHDVVVAIDSSSSTLRATSRDIDGDGIVGEPRRPDHDHPRRWTTDFDDTIFRAEIAAAERLVQRLDPKTTRVGLVTFSNRSRLRTPVGRPDRVLASLASVRTPKPTAGTSIARGIERSLEAMDAAPQTANEDARGKTILLLSDGAPTLPTPEKAEALTLEAAEAARRAGVRIHAFALGEEAIRETDVYRQIAERTCGTFVPVESPGEVMHYLPYVALTGLEGVRISNLTTDTPGEAIRVFPDGSFDGYVRLVPGENRIEVRAGIAGDREARATRTVFFVAPESPSPADLEAAEALRGDLRLRTIETELAVRAGAQRRDSGRVLQIRGDEETH